MESHCKMSIAGAEPLGLIGGRGNGLISGDGLLGLISSMSGGRGPFFGVS